MLSEVRAMALSQRIIWNPIKKKAETSIVPIREDEPVEHGDQGLREQDQIGPCHGRYRAACPHRGNPR